MQKTGLLVPLWIFFGWVGKNEVNKNFSTFEIFHTRCWKRLALSWDGWDRIQSSSLGPSDQIFYPDHQHCLEQLVKMRQWGWIGGGYDDRCFFRGWDLDSSIFVAVLRKIPIHHTQLNPLKHGDVPFATLRIILTSQTIPLMNRICDNLFWCRTHTSVSVLFSKRPPLPSKTATRTRCCGIIFDKLDWSIESGCCQKVLMHRCKRFLPRWWRFIDVKGSENDLIWWWEESIEMRESFWVLMKNVGGSSSNKKCHLSFLGWKHQFLWCVKTVDRDLFEEDNTDKDQLRYWAGFFDLQFTMWCWCGCTKSNKSSSKWVIAMTRIDTLIYSSHLSQQYTWFWLTPKPHWDSPNLPIHVCIYTVFPASIHIYIYYICIHIFVPHLHELN